MKKRIFVWAALLALMICPGTAASVSGADLSEGGGYFEEEEIVDPGGGSPEEGSPEEKKALADCLIRLESSRVIYKGKACKPGIEVWDGENILVKERDYRVAFVNNAVPGKASAVISGMGDYEGTVEKQFQIVPAAPKLKSAASAGYDSVKVSWSAVKGAQTYRLFYRKSSSSKWTRAASGIKKTSFTCSSLKTGVKYVFTVKAEAGGMLSDFDKKGVSAKPVLGTVKLRSAASAAYNKIKITWNAVPGATGYRVFRRQGAQWIRIADTKNTSYTHAGSVRYPVSTGVTYTYTVRALRKNGTGTYKGDYNKKGISAKAVPDTPKLISVYCSGTLDKVTVRWSKAAGASRYVIYRKTGKNGKWQKIAVVSGQNSVGYVQVPSAKYPLKKGRTYWYTVRSYSDTGGAYGGYDKKGLSVKIQALKEITEAELQKKAQEIIDRVTTPGMTKEQKLRRCWDYIMEDTVFQLYPFPDKTQKGWKYRCAYEFITMKRGNCYGYAHGFAALAKQLGYKPYVIEIPMVHCFVRIGNRYWDNTDNKIGVTECPMSYTKDQISLF